MTNIETLKQALEALEEAHPKPYNESVISHVEAITALRAAISEAEKQEPVAWAVVGDGEHGEYEVGRMLEKKSKPNSQYWEARGYSLVPLYTTPPAAQRQWVGLTGDEREQIYQEHYPDSLATTITAVEAKLKEKNT